MKRVTKLRLALVPRSDWFKNKFYVYGLFLPQYYYKGLLFYIGKGKGDRMFAHESYAASGGKCPKSVLIRQAWSDDKEVRHEIFFQTDSESEAYEYESALLKRVLMCSDIVLLNRAIPACFGQKPKPNSREVELDRLWVILRELYPLYSNEERQALLDDIVARDLMKEIFTK